MSASVLQIQQTLNDEHGAGLVEDGILGPATRAAIVKWQKVVTNTSLTDDDKKQVDERSEGEIARLQPAVQPLMRAVINRFNARTSHGDTLVLTSGLRDAAQQHDLFLQRPVVTRADSWQSNHNYGLASDFTIKKQGTFIWDSPEYHDLVGVIGKELGLTWGGDWKSIDDEPHLEFRPTWAHDLSESAMIAELHRRHNSGVDYLS